MSSGQLDSACTALDLPQLHGHPSPSLILWVLDALSTKSSNFEWYPDASPEDSSMRLGSVHGNGIPHYLTSIIGSSLDWIEDEMLRERIWQMASVRLSERAGRSAMPTVTRKFTIQGELLKSGVSERDPLEITIHEPSLTSDDLGLKTWAASYLLSKRLNALQSHLPERPLRVLELGAGTGLLGISFASIIPGTRIDLTDLPEIVPNLSLNLTKNSNKLQEVGSKGSVRVLDWNAMPELPKGNTQSLQEISFPAGRSSNHSNITRTDMDLQAYDVILAADPLYSPDHPALLIRAVVANLKCYHDATLIIELPLRDAYLPEVEEMQKGLKSAGLSLVDEGKEVGIDDWLGKGGERTEILCWWGVWRWQSTNP